MLARKPTSRPVRSARSRARVPSFPPLLMRAYVMPVMIPPGVRSGRPQKNDPRRVRLLGISTRLTLASAAMLARIRSAAVLGIDAYLVDVEVDISRGLPSFATVGLPQGAVKEGRERVYAAISNSGFERSEEHTSEL